MVAVATAAEPSVMGAMAEEAMAVEVGAVVAVTVGLVAVAMARAEWAREAEAGLAVV